MKPQYLVKLVWFDFIIKGGLLITSKVKFTISRMREFLDNSLTNKALFYVSYINEHSISHRIISTNGVQ